MLILILFSFLAGLATILAPCIWPILPVVLSSSIGSTSHKRPLGITIGVILSFSIFTLSISYLVSIFHVDPNIFRLFSVIVIGFFGLSLLIPALSLLIEQATGKLSGLFGGRAGNNSSGFLGGFITGLSLGIVWSPCAGPILAAIATLAATQKVTSFVVIITLAYALGTGIPLFLFSYGSQKILTKTKVLSKYTGTIQKVFGIIMILTAFAIYTNLDTAISADLLTRFPSFSSASIAFENNSLVTNTLDQLKGQASNTESSDLSNLGPAPDFVGITKWLNTDIPISIKELHGKVVLVDFWTYTCINCIRTLPFVTSWYDKYKDQGFVVIGIHTPEFAFEHDTNNVLNAIKQFNIHYPVAQDNDYATWNAYNNQYWPAEYLIDANGNIRETNFGEGNYTQTEQHIQELLKEAGQKQVASGTVNISNQTPTDNNQSPETYLGSDKAQFYYPNQTLSVGSKQFSLNPSIPVDSFDLGGVWNINPGDATSGPNATLEYHFNANKVYLVLNPAATTSTVKVFLDGKVVDTTNAGSDVQHGILTVDSDRLYNLIDLKGLSGTHMLRLEFQTPGIQAFAFTFG